MSKGCGCQKGVLKYIKPPYAKKFYTPCVMHDDDYDRGGDSDDRFDADMNLYVNMMKVVKKENKSMFAVIWFTFIASLYFVGVRLFGNFYFNYKK